MRIINHREFNVFMLEKSEWEYGYHNHNFYEIIVIDNGQGVHILNGVSFKYKKGDVFLLKPNDEHEFKIIKKTAFIYVKFTNHFITSLMSWNDGLKNKINFETILINTNERYESLITNIDDRKHFNDLSKMLLHEFTQYGIGSFELIFQYFLCLMFLLIRNKPHKVVFKSHLKNNKIEQIITYISINALTPEKMKIAVLAKEFAMSEKYISIYVKAQTGLSIQHHIIQTKLKAAEQLLRNSSFNINEIADKLGFLDASHFNKFFKLHKKVNPSEYRKG